MKFAWLRRLRIWFASLSPAKQMLLQDAFIWLIAGVMIWYVSRSLTLRKFFSTLEHANIGLFVGVNILSFFIWWIGETFLFATLFSMFHRRTTFREVLYASTAQYFLQAINTLVAAGALLVFLNRRKGVNWSTAGGTLMFEGLVDAAVLSSLLVIAALITDNRFVRMTLPYAAGALAFFLLVALWWRWSSGLTRTGRWLHELPWLYAFRVARLREYLILGLIRTAIYVPQGFLFYYELLAFGAVAPLDQVLALGPLMLLASGQPITPAGLGPLQAVMVDGLSQYSPRAQVLAASLGISIMRLLCRLPLGFGAAGTFARKVIQLETSPRHGDDNMREGAEDWPLEGDRQERSVDEPRKRGPHHRPHI